MSLPTYEDTPTWDMVAVLRPFWLLPSRSPPVCFALHNYCTGSDRRIQTSLFRRVPIAASSNCARALTCLHQSVEREQTWEALARLLLFPRIALAAPACGRKATRTSSTQQRRLNSLDDVTGGCVVARVRGRPAPTPSVSGATPSMSASRGRIAGVSPPSLPRRRWGGCGGIVCTATRATHSLLATISVVSHPAPPSPGRGVQPSLCHLQENVRGAGGRSTGRIRRGRVAGQGLSPRRRMMEKAGPANLTVSGGFAS